MTHAPHVTGWRGLPPQVSHKRKGRIFPPLTSGGSGPHIGSYKVCKSYQREVQTSGVWTSGVAKCAGFLLPFAPLCCAAYAKAWMWLAGYRVPLSVKYQTKSGHRTQLWFTFYGSAGRVDRAVKGGRGDDSGRWRSAVLLEASGNTRHNTADVYCTSVLTISLRACPT